MVLDLFFVATELAFQLGEGKIDGGQNIVMAFARDDIMLVLGLHHELDDLGMLVFEIDRDFNHRQPLEQSRQFFRFLPDELLSCFAKMPMPRGNLDLHEHDSLMLTGDSSELLELRSKRRFADSLDHVLSPDAAARRSGARPLVRAIVARIGSLFNIRALEHGREPIGHGRI